MVATVTVLGLCLAFSVKSIKAFSIQPIIPHQLLQTKSTTTQLFAKKKKGKKNKQQQKKGGFEWAASFTLQPFEAQAARELANTAMASFKGRNSGKHLFPDLETTSDLPKTLWNAQIACMIVGPSEDGSTDQGAVVKYANIPALETVGLKPTEFEKLFSTSPTQPPKEEEKGESEDGEEKADGSIILNLPTQMKGQKKFEREYRKKMLKRADGGDVTIIDAYRWDLEKSTIVGGKFVTESFGVAYAWSEWLVGDNLLCGPGGVQKEVEDLGDLEDRIAKQGAFIRDLKENQGFTNKSPEVTEAVAELMRLKELQG